MLRPKWQLILLGFAFFPVVLLAESHTSGGATSSPRYSADLYSNGGSLVGPGPCSVQRNGGFAPFSSGGAALPPMGSPQAARPNPVNQNPPPVAMPPQANANRPPTAPPTLPEPPTPPRNAASLGNLNSAVDGPSETSSKEVPKTKVAKVAPKTEIVKTEASPAAAAGDVSGKMTAFFEAKDCAGCHDASMAAGRAPLLFDDEGKFTGSKVSVAKALLGEGLKPGGKMEKIIGEFSESDRALVRAWAASAGN